MWTLPALLAGLLFCQDPVQQTVVITGNYQPLPLDEADRAIRTLPSAGRSALLVNSISDLFKQDASLDLQERAPGGVQGDLSIRGATFGQTLVLLNGMRLDDAQSGHHDLDIPLPLDAIEQIEVLHGAGSARYGSDALGGVVNVVPRFSQAREAALTAAMGNFGINQERLAAGFGDAKYSELLSVSRDFSTGFTNDRDYRNLSLSSSTMLKDAWGPASVLLALRDTPFGADQFYGNFDSWERTKLWYAAGHQNIGENTEADFAFRRHTDLFALFRENPAYYTNRHADESWEGSLRRTDDLPAGKLHYGAEFDADAIESNNLGRHSRNREGIYLDYDVRALKRFSLNAGLRDDVYRGLRNQLSPNLSGAAWLGSQWKLRAAVSRAFRVPTYTDLYYADPATLGNPNLKPETAWNYEGGLDWFASKAPWQGSVTFFQRHDTNIVDYVQSAPGALFRAMNFQKIVFTGVEASLRVRFGASVSYTYLHGDRTLAPGLISRYVFNYPVHNAAAEWEGNLPRGIVARTRIGAQQRLGAGPYGVWDASLAYAKGRVQPFLRVSNLTNTFYQELPNIPQPGRTLVGGVKLTWRPGVQ